MITRFRVKNYKSLTDIDIPLTPIHVIIGQNDTGKTSLLEAILAFCRSAEPRAPIAKAFEGHWQGTELVSFGAEQSIVEMSARLEDPRTPGQNLREYGFQAKFPDPEVRRCLVVAEWEGRIHRDQIALEYDPIHTSVSHRYHPSCPPSEALMRIEIANLIGSACLYRFDARLMKIPAALDEARVNRLDSDGFGLPTLLGDIRDYDRKIYDDLIRQFCKFFPEFEDIRFKTERGLKRQVDPSGLFTTSYQPGKGIYFVTRSGNEVRAQQASDGAILFLGFLALSYMPKPPNVLLIEEPETGVYPLRLQEIVGIFKHLIKSDGDRAIPQIVLTTHSPYLLSEFEPEEVTLMSRVGDKVIARPLRDAPHIHERLGGGAFYLGELWYNIPEEELFKDGLSADRH